MTTIGKTYRKKPQYIGHMPRNTAKVVGVSFGKVEVKYQTGRGSGAIMSIEDFERIYDTEGE